ncbi:hypothetical protein BU24DRAFT_449176 [Aaosphaeria arxii CBS 175.79]|uniref:Uncharacterized protein n=1 Tax=Aaosphaeria arxii CBS 175.79 TaxID=1450172 RepID=A0A6A5XY02_9PLEO|nr:uncharacterized protein BU24DRAFT_449176 [Aaosphaeria arxii CBS 175.79]KAF2017520.1 hypothetical protein BU24DRAFT_449176 [Aaosphaeria arxii CBS 175.79]
MGDMPPERARAWLWHSNLHPHKAKCPRCFHEDLDTSQVFEFFETLVRGRDLASEREHMPDQRVYYETLGTTMAFLRVRGKREEVARGVNVEESARMLCPLRAPVSRHVVGDDARARHTVCPCTHAHEGPSIDLVQGENASGWYFSHTKETSH